ncbi:VOC family protein [Aestuariispira ectoiniformans]|uniref:VOC family protein n=1 Tax=Aestuariispira ectoiniformans TaxID=2775080 RepID=UPI00223B9ECB|nr:VOC family protein [Aestuariispira ectoiniformans]
MSKHENAAPARCMHSLSPHLVCEGAAAAVDFYKKAFGAEEMMRIPAPDGRLMHACLWINGSTVIVMDAFPEMGAVSPQALGGSPVTLHLIVEDTDSAFDRAIDAGAVEVAAPDDMFWGDRYAVVKDPFGHSWSIATPQKNFSEEEIIERAKSVMMECG